MTTPNRREIIEKAKELFMEHSIRNGIEPINPEEYELQESGFISAAKSELMTDNDKVQIEEFFKDRPQNSKKSSVPFEDLFDLEESKNTNILISGTNYTGKTRLACAISSMLHKLGYRVIVYDVSGVWKQISDLPYLSRPFRKRNNISYNRVDEANVVYDLSLLKSGEVRRIVEIEMENLWNTRIEEEAENPVWLIFEEAEIYLRNIRGGTSENVYRVVHVGRNVAVRTILITTDLALLDASVIRLCGIRFHGRLGIEENAKRKFRSYYGSDVTHNAEKLETGYFIRLHKGNLDTINVPLFKRNRVSQDLSKMVMLRKF